MKILLFYHSLLSDWNHGNAHFLRGIYHALQMVGHDVSVLEQEGNWSLTNLMKDNGTAAVRDFRNSFPNLRTNFYGSNFEELDQYLKDADLVMVHEWTDPSLAEWLGEQKQKYRYVLLFHDTHHRAVSDPASMAQFKLSQYDGVLAFGESLRQVYLKNNWHHTSWTWHEAADTSHYFPILNREKTGDVVWIGNWGDDERTEELEEYLIAPIRKLKLKATFYGVRYPDKAKKLLKDAGISYGGYLSTSKVSETFARYRATIHVPRRFYTQYLPGIPTIRPFEALASGIPLLCAPWDDSENLFTPGKDYLVANSGDEMTQLLDDVLNEKGLAEQLIQHGRQTILAKHTCFHRAEELIAVYEEVRSTYGAGREISDAYKSENENK
nr:glycosyltransferase [Cytophagales bacterium]